MEKLKKEPKEGRESLPPLYPWFVQAGGRHEVAPHLERVLPSEEEEPGIRNSDEKETQGSLGGKISI